MRNSGLRVPRSARQRLTWSRRCRRKFARTRATRRFWFLKLRRPPPRRPLPKRESAKMSRRMLRRGRDLIHAAKSPALSNMALSMVHPTRGPRVGNTGSRRWEWAARFLNVSQHLLSAQQPALLMSRLWVARCSSLCVLLFGSPHLLAFLKYEDGEVRRYGAGESYRPFNRDRSPPPPPRDIRSPLRDPSRSIRSPLRDNLRDNLRDRGRTPPLPGASDSYVPNRSPRRRSRSADRFRRERSRERDGGERWRRSRSRQRSPIRIARSPIRVARSPIRVARSPIRVARSPIRRPSPRRSPLRRSPPPRFVSPRRDDRARSPLRRDFEIRESIRRRSRSPFDRLRRGRSPPRRSPPHGPRGGASYRPRSRSPNRRGIDDHYPGPAYRRPSPPLLRDSINTSMMNSRPASGISSPRPASIRGRDDRSGPQSPTRSHMSNAPTPTSAAPPSREMPKPPPVQPALPGRPTQSTPKQPVAEAGPAPARSPPRGPASLRVPPTGPAAARNLPSPAAPQTTQATRHPPPQVPSGPARPDTTSPTVPPAGPRGYVPPRAGSFASRGGRGSWSAGVGRHSISSGGQSVSPTVPPAGPSSGGGGGAGGNSSGNSTAGIPTGPRAQTSTSAASSPSLPSPATTNKPFNPPTGPAAQHGSCGGGSGAPHTHNHNHTPHARASLAQTLMNTMPPIIPGGKVDPSWAGPGEMDPHHRKLREEEERLREELRVKQERLRKSLRMWDRLERESKGFELKSDLSERSLKNIAGEGVGGGAF
ncbi:hypothetical protein BT67DRAFT_62162 [Trichocladium antarcticum]|uniref:Serine/arginine repetitive matrix protein 1 n=1 Tax=Trichocladium antarcticum TaxID=1450529 RepID=A0AAN6UIB2_9PEZI|nr:hypothetical protein BT67DRAFT_62162 [Trichocladium antarcticum]